MTTKQLLRGLVVVALLLTVSLPFIAPSWALGTWIVVVGYWLLLPASYITLVGHFAVRHPRWPFFRTALISGGVLATTAVLLSFARESEHLEIFMVFFVQGSWFSLLLSYCLKPPRARRLGARWGLSVGALVVWFLFLSGILFQKHWLSTPEPGYATFVNINNFYDCLLIITVIPGWAAFVGSQLGLVMSQTD